MGVPTSKRIRRRYDFQMLRSSGKRLFSGSFVCQYYLSPQQRSAARRLGVIASRRVGNAVKRNRGKRIVRELFRMHEAELPSNCDLLIILRSNFALCSFEEMKSQYLKFCTSISKDSSAQNPNDL